MHKVKKHLKAVTVLLLIFTTAMLPVCSLPWQSTAKNTDGQEQEDGTPPFPELSARSAVLIDAFDLTVLGGKSENTRMGMASTTKIMTALVICERLPLDMMIEIPPEAVNVEGSSVYLRGGELLSVEALLCSLLLASANDAAVALAVALCGSVESFAKEMNRRAEEMGLVNTHFDNPHGLDSEGHYTTAYELAVISAHALKNPTLRRIASTKKMTVPLGATKCNTQGEGVRYLTNHNKMLSLYDGAIGLKTGFTKKTGRCLVSAAERDGLMLIAVTLSAPDDWNDHKNMLDFGFSKYETVTLYGVGEFSTRYYVTGGTEPFVYIANTKEIKATLPKKREEADICVYAHQHFGFAPVEQGSVRATLCVRIGSKTLTSPLAATSPSMIKKKGSKQ